MFWDIIGIIIAGAIIGVIARVVVPGKQAMPWWLTIVTGIVAVLIGRLVAGFFGVAQTSGVDWIRWIITIIIGAILVAVVAAVYPRIRGGSSTAS